MLLSGLLTLTLFHCSVESLHVPQERSEVSPGLTCDIEIYKLYERGREGEGERERGGGEGERERGGREREGRGERGEIEDFFL